MVSLEILNIEFLEIADTSIKQKLAPIIGLEFGGILLVNQLLRGLDHGVVSRVEEEGNRKPLLLRVRHHPVLYALVLIVAPHLKKMSRLACES